MRAFPEHEAALRKRFALADADPIFCETLAGMIERIAGETLAAVCDDYRWLAGAVLEEELFFRREGRYRLTSFAEAEALVYADAAYMTRYMNGLLLSQLWWANHTAVLAWFRDRYLPANRPGARHLEVGPGHGLFLHLAASDARTSEATGWDVSPASLDQVRHTFAALGKAPPPLSLVNLFEPSPEQFDSICFSEVLEHLETPAKALARVHDLLAPGGRAFINAPVNSPAPDHITLFSTPEAIVELVSGAGLVVEELLLAPSTGASLERARKFALAISTVIIARRAD
ncbi:MAG: methyltransferase domain-containing protein [Caulobacter sp.]|nr:methyltransferase domain-containing protein [Caulobacter sp.]